MSARLQSVCVTRSQRRAELAAVHRPGAESNKEFIECIVCVGKTVSTLVPAMAKYTLTLAAAINPRRKEPARGRGRGRVAEGARAEQECMNKVKRLILV